MESGIDISHWNRVRDFTKVKASGIDFVIIKAGGSDKGFYQDVQFENYYRLSKLAGLKVGSYYYAGPNFYGAEAGELDAMRFCRIIQSKTFEYPVVIDIEETSISSSKVRQTTLAAIAFCKYMEAEGYYSMIYSSDISGFKERLDIDMLNEIDKWVARYGKNRPSYVENYGIWQRSSTGRIDGIDGNVDLDTSFKDYEKIIKKKRLNGWT